MMSTRKSDGERKEDSEQHHHQSQSSNAAHELSHYYRQKTKSDFYYLVKYYNILIGVAFVFSLAIVAMSSYWANITGMSDKYTSVSSNWEACLTQADYQTIPFKELVQQSSAGPQAAFSNCLISLYPTCSGECLLDIKSDCASILSSGASKITNVNLPTGKYLASLSYLGVQNVIFAAMAHVNMRRALLHPTWLMSSIGVSIWFLFSYFCYYPIGPILPVPTQTVSTFLTILYYNGSKGKFDSLNGGNNQCDNAFLYVWVYLTFMLLLAATIFMGTCVGIYAEFKRYKSRKSKAFVSLDHTEIPVSVGALGILFYLTLAASKLTSSYNNLNAINNFDYTTTQAVAKGYKTYFTRIYYPFPTPALDVNTILCMAACISILRGYSIQSVSAFRLAAIASAVFCYTAWPQITGAYSFYFHHSFQHFDNCYQFFLNSQISSQFGYPSEDEAKVYCYSFRTALVSSTGLLVLMHIVFASALYMAFQNKERASMEHESLDFGDLVQNVVKSAPPAADPAEPVQTNQDISPVKKENYVDNPMGRSSNNI